MASIKEMERICMPPTQSFVCDSWPQKKVVYKGYLHLITVTDLCTRRAPSSVTGNPDELICCK